MTNEHYYLQPQSMMSTINTEPPGTKPILNNILQPSVYDLEEPKLMWF